MEISLNAMMGDRRDVVFWLQLAVTAVVVVVGLHHCVRATSAAIMFLWRQYFRPSKSLSTFGEWAVVTGATDGIGRAYCDKLAEQGMLLRLPCSALTSSGHP
jgi:nucleoside recognition membrane protein YjiH